MNESLPGEVEKGLYFLYHCDLWMRGVDPVPGTPWAPRWATALKKRDFNTRTLLHVLGSSLVHYITILSARIVRNNLQGHSQFHFLEFTMYDPPTTRVSWLVSDTKQLSKFLTALVPIGSIRSAHCQDYHKCSFLIKSDVCNLRMFE